MNILHVKSQKARQKVLLWFVIKIERALGSFTSDNELITMYDLEYCNVSYKGTKVITSSH